MYPRVIRSSLNNTSAALRVLWHHFVLGKRYKDKPWTCCSLRELYFNHLSVFVTSSTQCKCPICVGIDYVILIECRIPPFSCSFVNWIWKFEEPWVWIGSYLSPVLWDGKECIKHTHPDSSNWLLQVGSTAEGTFEGTLQLLWQEYHACRSCIVPLKYSKWYSNLQ